MTSVTFQDNWEPWSFNCMLNCGGDQPVSQCLDLSDLVLDLGLVIWHTVVYHSSTSCLHIKSKSAQRSRT